MSVQFPADVEAKVKRMVESGRYSDSGEALREAIRLLEDRDRRMQHLRALLAEVEQGDAIPYTPELLYEIDQEVDERIRRGDKPSQDVRPVDSVLRSRRAPEAISATSWSILRY